MVKKRIKRILAIVLVLTLVFTLVGCGGASDTPAPNGDEGQDKEPMVLKLQGAFPEGTAHYIFFDEFCRLVEERSNGTLLVEWGAGPEAIPSTELAEAMVNGIVELVFSPATYLVTVAPILNCVRMTTPQEMRANNGAGVEIIDKIAQEQLNVKFLARTAAESPYFMAVNKKITKLSDFKGLVLRGNAAYLPMIEGVGAEMASMGWGEMYQAVERNVIDGVGGTMKDYIDNSLGSVLDYLIRPGFFNSDSSLWVALHIWEQLDDVQRQALLDSALDWELWSADYNIKEHEEYYRLMEEAGTEMLDFEGELLEEWLTVIYDNGWARVEQIDPEIAQAIRALTSN